MNRGQKSAAACLLIVMLCLGAKNDAQGQEAPAPKTFAPKFVSDEPIPKSIAQLLNELGVLIHPEVRFDQTTKEDVSQFIETMLSGLHFKDLRVDRPVLLSNPTKISYESHGDSSLKLICVLSERAQMPFSITENHTFVFEPIRSDCVEYQVEFVGYTNGQETFKVTKKR